jgi:ankyrin repeat protein
MYASRVGNIDLVLLLVESGADLNIAAKYNLSALMLAIINGQSEIVRILIEAGADLTIRGKGAIGFDGKTALILAKERGQERTISLLQLAGAKE